MVTIEKEILVRFVKWVKLKVRIHTTDKYKLYFKEREIWWANVGENIGHEQNGKNENFSRPILVLKKYNKDMLLMLPLTSKEETKMYHQEFKYNNYRKDGIAIEENGKAILDQIRTISSKRLFRKMGIVPKPIFTEIKERIIKEFI